MRELWLIDADKVVRWVREWGNGYPSPIIAVTCRLSPCARKRMKMIAAMIIHLFMRTQWAIVADDIGRSACNNHTVFLISSMHWPVALPLLVDEHSVTSLSSTPAMHAVVKQAMLPAIIARTALRARMGIFSGHNAPRAPS